MAPKPQPNKPYIQRKPSTPTQPPVKILIDAAKAKPIK